MVVLDIKDCLKSKYMGAMLRGKFFKSKNSRHSDKFSRNKETRQHSSSQISQCWLNE